MTRWQVAGALAAGVAVSLIIDAAVFWFAPNFDRNIFAL